MVDLEHVSSSVSLRSSSSPCFIALFILLKKSSFPSTSCFFPRSTFHTSTSENPEKGFLPILVTSFRPGTSIPLGWQALGRDAAVKSSDSNQRAVNM